jgi:hypothetical protein
VTPEQVLKSIVDGINTGNLDALMKGTLDLNVTRVLQASDLALVVGCGHSWEPGRTVDP